MSDLATKLSRELQARNLEIEGLRRLLGDVYTALLAAGWREDELIKRVREARTTDVLAYVKRKTEQIAAAEAQSA